MPEQLIQLVYASRSNLDSAAIEGGVEPEIARILVQSRRNNPCTAIGGVLCYGDRSFFQCLEGEHQAVEELYAKLGDDERHRDVTLLLRRPVSQRRFRLWAMKYLTVDRRIRDQLRHAGLSRFDPYQFDEEMIDLMLDVLREAVEGPQPAGNGETDRPGPASTVPLVQRLAYVGLGAVLGALLSWLVAAEIVG